MLQRVQTFLERKEGKLLKNKDKFKSVKIFGLSAPLFSLRKCNFLKAWPCGFKLDDLLTNREQL